MPNKKSNTPYFKSLKLENVRSFGKEQVLDLTREDGNLAQWTLLLGENGVGKTTLLQSLAWMRPTFQGSEKSKLGGGPALPDEENEVLESLLRSGKKTIGLSAEICPGTAFGGEVLNVFSTEIIAKYDVKGFLKSSDPSWIDHVSYKRKFGDFQEPFIVTYGANRYMGTQNTRKSELEDPIASRLDGFTELYDIEEILTELDYAAAAKYRKGKEHKLLENLKKAVVKILPGDHSTEDIEIKAGQFTDGEFKRSAVRLRTFSGSVRIRALSFGYQIMLAWVLDFAWRLSQQYSESSDPMKEPAIVLIDEVDLHLHPKWQLTVMDALSELFSRTQFIATSHSPLMVQSKPVANFAVVSEAGNEALIENEPMAVRGWRVDQILTSDYFGLSSSRDAETEDLYIKRKELVEKSKRSPAEEKQLKTIENKILDLPTASDPVDIEAMALIRQTAQLLKQEKKS